MHKKERNLYLLPVLPQGQAFPARRSSRRRSISDLTKSDKFLTRPNGRQKQPTPNEQFARVLQAMREPIGDATTGTSGVVDLSLNSLPSRNGQV